MANDRTEDAVRRRGTDSQSADYGTIGDALGEGDAAWNRDPYTTRSDATPQVAQADLDALAVKLRETIAECAPVIEANWVKFEQHWNSLWNSEAPEGGMLTHLLAGDYHASRHGLPRGLDLLTAVALSGGGTQIAEMQDLDNHNSVEGVRRGATISDVALGLETLREILTEGVITTLRFEDGYFDKFLTGAGLGDDAEGIFGELLHKTFQMRIYLTEVKFGQLHAGGMSDLYAHGDLTKYISQSDTTAPFVSGDAQKTIMGATPVNPAWSGTLHEKDNILIEDAYGNQVLDWNHPYVRATAIAGAATLGEGIYIYPRQKDEYNHDRYIFSQQWWERALAQRYRGFQTVAAGSRDDKPDIEEMIEWELAEAGELAAFEESKRLTLDRLANRYDSFLGYFRSMMSGNGINPQGQVQTIANFQGHNLSQVGVTSENPLGVKADGTPISIAEAFEQIGIHISTMWGAVQALEDCIYKVWDVCDRFEKTRADASESVLAHVVVGDFYDTAFTYTAEERKEHQAAADEFDENAVQTALDRAFIDESKVLYREQCFLLTYIQQIAAWKRDNRDSAAPPSNLTSAPAAQGAAIVAGRTFKRLPYQPTSLNPNQASANASLLVDGDPYGFLNKLIQTPGQQALFDLENHQLSALQPMIRLFKIEYDNDGNERQHEIHFDSNANNIESALQNKKQRGFGVGIKSFNFSYEGTNPFAVKKSIKAQLNIFANTFTELFEQRGPYRYVDLALKTGGAGATGEACENSNTSSASYTKLQNENLSKLNFRLKAVVGWAPQGRTVASGGILGAGLRDALYESYATLELTPTVHNFDFDEMGRVNFQINYLAYVEDYFDDTSFNIFTKPNLASAQLARELEIDYFSGRCDASQISLLKKSFAEEIRTERKEALAHLINTIIKNRKIYYIKLPYEDIRLFLSQGPFAEYENALNFDELIQDYTDTDALDKALTRNLNAFASLIAPPPPPGEEDERDDENLIAAALLAGIDSESESLPFIFISELIDLVLLNLEGQLSAIEAALTNATGIPGLSEQGNFDHCRKILELKKTKADIQQFKKMRVLLGPVEFVNPAQGSESIFVNLGDIPLSIKYFMEWISEQMLNKEQAIYSLTKFLNDLFNNIVRNFLNNDSCFSYSTAQKTRVNQAVVTSYPGGIDPSVDEITKSINAITRPGVSEPKRIHINTMYNRSKPVLKTSGIPGTPIAQRTVAQEMNWFVYFAGRTAPTEFMNGKRDEDAARGIFHYLLGRDRGMIKNISLSKTDSKGLAEVRFEQDGYDGLKQLRVVYDVEIDTYADVKTYPGTYLFVNPQGFDPNSSLIACHESNLTQYGIGGYFMIWKSEHSFGPGQASTKIHAKWVNQVESEDCTIQGRSSDEDQPDGTNCGSARVVRQRATEARRISEEQNISLEEANEQLEQQYPT